MSSIWPDDLRCVVMLGFDVDGVSGAINSNPEAARLPSLMSMREYGPSVGTPRILELLDDYDIKASFYIPGYVAETHEALVVNIRARGHEIAHHGYLHEPPAGLSTEQEEEVLDRGITIIEGITGEKPRGYRSPSWELSEDSLSLLASRGFLYDSSLMGDDIPYTLDADGRTLVEIPVHWELDDFPYFNYTPFLGQRFSRPIQVAGFQRIQHRMGGPVDSLKMCSDMGVAVDIPFHHFPVVQAGKPGDPGIQKHEAFSQRVEINV